MAMSCLSVKAQDIDSLLAKGDDYEFTTSDSLAIFQLFDSLMNLEDLVGSQLAFRLSYNSNVLAAGRTLGIEQFGLAPGISYYHKSGAYADISAFWSKDFEPPFYLTTLSAGYLHIFSRKFSMLANYDHYFYTDVGDDSYTPYTNAATISSYLDFRHVSFRTDYSYYFGDARAHRIMPALGLVLRKKNLLGIDRVSFLPTFYMLMGDVVLNEVEFVDPKTPLERFQNRLKYGTPYSILIKDKRVFGILNYAISCPLSLTIKNNWMFNITYTYNIPKAVEDEPLVLGETGYLSASFVYYLDLRKK